VIIREGIIHVDQIVTLLEIEEVITINLDVNAHQQLKLTTSNSHVTARFRLLVRTTCFVVNIASTTHRGLRNGFFCGSAATTARIIFWLIKPV